MNGKKIWGWEWVLQLLYNIRGVVSRKLILNSAARAVTKTPKFHHITPHLKSLHWLKITQRIQYKILSLTYKSLQYNKPSSISDLLTIQPTRSTRSSAEKVSAIAIPILGQKYRRYRYRYCYINVSSSIPILFYEQIYLSHVFFLTALRKCIFQILNCSSRL